MKKNTCNRVFRLSLIITDVVGVPNGRGPKCIEPAEPAIATPLRSLLPDLESPDEV